MSLTFPEFLLGPDFDVSEGALLREFDTVAGTEDKAFEEECSGCSLGSLQTKTRVREGKKLWRQERTLLAICLKLITFSPSSSSSAG